MKALLINGSPHPKGCTYTALEELARTLEAEGIETEIVQAGGRVVCGCTGCGACRKLGKCVYDDAVNETSPKLLEADALVIGAPVHYASPAGDAISFMDRLFYSTGIRNLTMKVGRGGGVLPPRRQHLQLRCAEQVFHHLRHAHRQQPVLEHGVRQYTGGGAPGQGGPPDHADAGTEHGVPHEGHPAGQDTVRSAPARSLPRSPASTTEKNSELLFPAVGVQWRYYTFETGGTLS